MLDQNEAQVVLSQAPRVPTQVSSSPRRQAFGLGEWLGWLGLTAGGTMLVGAVALWAAMRPAETPRLRADTVPCTCPDVCATSKPIEVGQPQPNPHPPAKPTPRPRPSVHRPKNSGEPSTADCDGRDPLCGLDLGALDDISGKPTRGGRQRPSER